MRRRRVGDSGPEGDERDAGGGEEQTNTDADNSTVSQQNEAVAEIQDDSFKCTCRIPRWLFWGVVSFVVSTSVMMAVFMAIMRFVLVSRSIGTKTHMQEELGVDGIMLFRQYDRDDDGYLSLGEFEPLAHLLRSTNSTFEYPVEIADTDEFVTVKPYFTPLILSTMTKDMNSAFATSLDALIGLKSWQKPNIPWMNFGASEFKVFLPKSQQDLHKLGEVYDIIVFEKGGFFDGPLSNNRYYPPRIKTEEILIHRLLTLFHPRPFIHPRFKPQGSAACVRAYNDKYLSIVFRIHAEFQLNEPPFHPFWFTPAQFTGELIITKNASSIFYFNMYVPSVKKLNVDMEWLNGPRENDNMEVDIGFMPLMELNVTSSSIPAAVDEALAGLNDKVSKGGSEEGPQVVSMKEVPLPEAPGLMTAVNNIHWTEEISMEEAFRKLEVYKYKFKTVPYLNFTEAYEKAEEEKKLIHSILLWGALDDQSC